MTELQEYERTDQARMWRHENRLPYHLRQFETPYRSTVHLGRFIERVIGSPEGEALDVACGAGANISYLAGVLPGLRWTGVDLAGEMLFPIGASEFARRGVSARLLEADLFRLTDAFPDERFDLVLSIQTLLGLPGYERALDQLMAVTRGWLVVTSLFTDYDVDVRVEATDRTRPEGCRGPFYYNVYGVSRFRDECFARGCREFVTEDFEIDVDLPSCSRGMQTYTRRLADGRRLQCSGPLHMPWKFAAIRMGEA
jgi:SAM-dependent methyltransferase